MTTPPRVSRAEVDAAIERIRDRHVRVSAPRLELLGESAWEVRDYVIRYGKTVPLWVQTMDIDDALVVHVWLWWEHQRGEKALLDRGFGLGMTNRHLGRRFGVGSKEGMANRRGRLRSLLSDVGVPDEKIDKAARASARAESPTVRWCRERTDDLRALFSELDSYATAWEGHDEIELYHDLVNDPDPQLDRPVTTSWTHGLMLLIDTISQEESDEGIQLPPEAKALLARGRKLIWPFRQMLGGTATEEA